MSDIYQHFRLEEKEFVDQVISWQASVELTYSSKLTDFLDPRQQYIVSSIIGKNDTMKVSFCGGAEENERKRALIYPDYYEVVAEDYDLTLYNIHYPVKFVTLTHPQILGSLMSLGIKREKFGDIILEDNNIQIIVDKTLGSYLENNLHAIGKAKVSLEKCSFDQMIAATEEWKETSITLQSVRLDAYLSHIYPISRQKAQLLIANKKVKVNWAVVENKDFSLQEADIISTKGYGRSKIISFHGLTKKEKWRITAGILN